MSDGMVEFNKGWVRASQVESIWPVNVSPLQGNLSYQVKMRLLSGREWVHTVSTAQAGYTDGILAEQKAARDERDAYMTDFMHRLMAAHR